MNIKAIKEVVDSPFLGDDTKERLIISILSQDENVIPDIMEILHKERNEKDHLIKDLNLEVSRYHVSISNFKLLKTQLSFYNEETKKLYEKWKHYISPLFNNKFD